MTTAVAFWWRADINCTTPLTDIGLPGGLDLGPLLSLLRDGEPAAPAAAVAAAACIVVASVTVAAEADELGDT